MAAARIAKPDAHGWEARAEADGKSLARDGIRMSAGDDDGVDLQVRQNLQFQGREWRRSRLLWIALLVFMSATALGLFGHGPVSRAERSTDDGAFRIAYERFSRFGAATRVSVTLRSAPGTPVEITVDRGYLQGMRVERILPEPIEEQPTGDGVLFRFAESSAAALHVHFDVQPVRRFGILGTMSSGGRALTFSQFIYP
jgi:hypothetical protein